MTITEENRHKYMINPGTDQSNTISELFPQFYEENKEAVDSGRIKLFSELWAMEAGVLIDMKTLEIMFVDYRN